MSSCTANRPSTLEGISLKKLHQGVGGGGGAAIGPLLSTFDTIHLTDLIFATYDKLSLCIQLIETTWCLISFHSNHSYIHDVTSGRHFRFSNFQTFFIFELNTENGENKI